MRFKTVASLALAASAVIASGCASVASPVGFAAFTNVSGPVTATENAGGAKEGQACATNILGLIATGDASVEAAARNGGISKISSVDHDSLGVLSFYSKFCTVVKGN